MAISNGVDVKTLSTIIGHVSSATMLRINNHISDDIQRISNATSDHTIESAVRPERDLVQKLENSTLTDEESRE